MKQNLLSTLKNISIDELGKVISEFKKYQSDKTVLLLKGGMGAGKTTFTRTLLESFGISGVQSPTFALHNRYQYNGMDIEHLDLFRMKSELELDGLGFWDFFEVDKGLVIIEWPERMDVKNLPGNWRIIQLSITSTPDHQRNFEFIEILAGEINI